jgi:hypothetical protein
VRVPNEPLSIVASAKVISGPSIGPSISFLFETSRIVVVRGLSFGAAPASVRAGRCGFVAMQLSYAVVLAGACPPSEPSLA